MPVLTPDYSNLNPDEMAAAIGLKPKHIPMLIGSFLDESKGIMESLSQAIDASDYNAIKSHAHSIKGSAGNLKFTEIYEMAKEVELAGADSNADFDYKPYVDAISAAIATIPN
ncbi:Hpt domain-containing protein [Sulfurimonas sp. SAG-AH-194-I05]|nr:Hpt domain-containing protein [Sulfurimonas sp. SAG-AH-194-I05]MDF1874838.1 Hpt domain-containing protein [Sulfurimonas sp. SAG-AH-194-I05]